MSRQENYTAKSENHPHTQQHKIIDKEFDTPAKKDGTSQAAKI
jgi:hypothetical protein